MTDKPGTIYIAGHPIWPPVVLAPMEGVTDRPFRTLVRSLGGVGLTVTEFVSSEALTREVQQAWRMAELDPEETPVSIQIYGRDPERMAMAARHCENLGATFVDINLGCPSKRVTSGCAGSALMREPELADEIFRAVAGAVRVPFTVKMRLGWDHTDYSAPSIAAAAERAGAAMVAVHGRTKSDGYKNRSRWELVADVKKAITVPLLVNGDIVDATTARDALEQSGADGVMMGRAVMSDPWALRRVAHELYGFGHAEPDDAEKRQLLHDYLNRVQAGGEVGRRSVDKLRKVISYVSRGMPGAARLRASLNSVHDIHAARSTVDEFFDFAETAAAAPPA
jgi:tRNA-dihydrouridine synthase B